MKKLKEMPELKAQSPDDDDFETEDHLKTLMRAEKIKGDTVKMEKVHALAGRHRKALDGIGPKKPKNVKDLKDIYQKKYSKKPE